MPPPRQTGSPSPLDPFPPLTASLRPIVPIITYASVARSPSTETRPTEPPPAEPTATEGGPSTTGWTVQDVDTNDVLDEIRLFPSSSPDGPERIIRPDQADPPRGYTRRGVVHGTQTVYAPSLASVLSPTSGHRPTASSTIRLTSESSPRRIRQRNPTGDSLPILSDSASDVSPRTIRRRHLTEFDSARRTWQGGIAAAFQQGYDEHGDDGETIPSSEADHIPLRRRGPRLSLGQVVTRSAGPSTDTPHTTWLMGDEDESEEDEEDPVDHAQPPRGPRHRVSTFYSHPNITGDIVESEWSFVGAPLHRGGNNRRRQSLRRRHAEGADDTVTLGSHVTPAMIPPSVAMNPTNPRHVQRQPSIVLSSGTRRPRSSSTSSRDEVYKQDGYEDDEIVEYKRRRVSISSRDAGRPAYMVHATPNNPNMMVPTSFNEPPSDSFLDLTVGTTGRPLIKFFDNPNLTETDNDACNLHTGIPIDRACGVHYFEVECIDQGKEGFMSVGWTIAGTSPDRLVGWDKGTWGWHADDGMCFNQSGSGSESAAKWGSGDTVGCGIDFTTARAFLTKNGEMIGHRFKDLDKKDLYPAIGLRSAGEELSVNFTGPFRFDIVAHIRQIKDDILASVTRFPVFQIPGIPDMTAEPVESDDSMTIESDDSMMVKTDDSMTVDEVAEQSGAKPAVESGDAAPKTTSAVTQANTPDDQAAEQGAQLSRATSLEDPIEKGSAALVLDFLRQRGHSATLELFGKELHRRRAVPVWPPAGPATDDHLPIINKINKMLLLVDQPVPLALIQMVVPVQSRYFHWFQTHQLVYLNQKGRASQEEVDTQKAIQYGSDLRVQSEKNGWHKDDTKLLLSAYRTLPVFLFGANETGPWAEGRRADAKCLHQHLRAKYGLPSESILEHSIRSLAHVPIDAHNTFVDCRTVLGLREGPVAKTDPDAGDEK